jgi:nucleoid-associated protein YgaU
MHLLDDPPAAPAPAPATPPADDTYVVRPGDNFWAIASRHLGDPPDARVVPYWRALIAANADRVHDPSLLFAGQVLRLPASLPRTD